MEIFYESDWHIHSEASYDAEIKVPELLALAEKNGIKQLGITDHVNYPFMVKHLERSRDLFLANKRDGFHLGVELTTIPKQQYDFALKHPADADDRKTWLRGFIPSPIGCTKPSLSLSEEELERCGVEYVVAGAHWPFTMIQTRKSVIKDYHAQQMFIAEQKCVDIIAHPWWVYIGRFYKNGVYSGLWYDDFDRVPRSMHEEFAAAVLENGKMVELNTDFFVSGNYPERFKKQYAEYIAMLHEKGIPITIGSDLHSDYTAHHEQVKRYTAQYGFNKDTFAVPKFR